MAVFSGLEDMDELEAKKAAPARAGNRRYYQDA